MKLEEIRALFPILKEPIYGQRLAYLDNAATTQKPEAVIESYREYFSTSHSNIHRSVHHLSEKATQLYEQTREQVRQFINAPSANECIFVKGTTDAINLVAFSFGEAFIKAGDEILISAMEHHSNLIPWQMLCQRKGAHLKIIPMTEKGELDLTSLPSLLTPNTKLLAISHASNALGTLNPIADIIRLAHQKNIPVLVDGAQSAPHLKIDVQALDCDFFTFSGHKLYGPTGVGVLYGKTKWLDKMPPYQGGGNMMLNVSYTDITYNELPYKFEAGTPAIAEVIALGSALRVIETIGFQTITPHENHLLKITNDALTAVPGLKIIGEAQVKLGVISFIMEDIHPHDIASILDRQGVAIRAGRHCAIPVMDFFGVPATARVSFAMYNSEEDIEQLIRALHLVNKVFKK